MATPTYTLISEQVLGSAVNSVTFSSIPQTYKDLVLEVVCTSTGWCYGRLNGDASALYSATRLQGDGTSASSSRLTNGTSLDFSVDFGAGNMGTIVLQLLSYANTSVYKTVLARVGTTTSRVHANVHLWQSLSAVTSISLYPDGFTGYNFGVGSTFRLWGIA